MNKMIFSSLVAILLLNGCDGNGDPKTSIEEATNREEVLNKAPIVNAGADKTVTVNETMTLIGTASDSDGAIASYEWKKGTETLSNTSTLTYIPTKVGVDTLVLVVMDDDGESSSDSVTITVTDITEPSNSTPSETSEQNDTGSKEPIFS